MTPGQLQLAAPYLAAGLLALALVFFLISLRFFRKSRTDFYWRRRRAAGQRGWQLFVWALALTLCSGGACNVTAGSALHPGGEDGHGEEGGENQGHPRPDPHPPAHKNTRRQHHDPR